MNNCTEYVEMDDEEGYLRPCHCPVCGGFLKWPDITETPVCNKCHTPLIAIPDQDEETGEFQEWGKICALHPIEYSSVVQKERDEMNSSE